MPQLLQNNFSSKPYNGLWFRGLGLRYHIGAMNGKEKGSYHLGFRV